MTPQFERDLQIAAALGHGDFSMDIKRSEYLGRDKYWFICACGFRSTVRWSPEDAMQTARHHIQTVAREQRSKNSRNGLGNPPNHTAVS